MRYSSEAGRPEFWRMTGSTGSTWGYGNASVCFGSWDFGYASLVPRLRKPILNGRRRIKKTPRADGRCCGRPLGNGRSTLPAARLPLPHVGAPGNQGPRAAASSDAAQCGILRCRTVAGGKFQFSRETGKFNAVTFFTFLKGLRRTSIRTGRRVVVITDNARYHHA